MKRWGLFLIVLLLLGLLPPLNTMNLVKGQAPYVSIQEIQGHSDSSPYKGQVVITRGVVTAIFSDGFFIQNGTGAWSGIFVYTKYTPEYSDTGGYVQVGDYIEIQSKVSEYKGMTELNYYYTSGEKYLIKIGMAEVPAPEILPTNETMQEKWEGVLVKVMDARITGRYDSTKYHYTKIWVNDGSGEALLFFKPEASDELLEGLKFKYVVGPVKQYKNDYEILPVSYGVYNPKIKIISITYETPYRGMHLEIKIRVLNNDTKASNATVIVKIDSEVIYSSNITIGASETKEVSLVWTPNEVKDYTLDIIAEEDERILTLTVYEHPETIAYGVVTYYQSRYEYYGPQLTILYNQFKSLLGELQSYNVDLSAIQENIEEIESKMRSINERYSKYQLLKERTKGAYYSVLMIPIMKATILTRETIEELENLIPLLNSTLEQARAAAEQNVTIVVPKVHKVLIDSSHNQYYSHERMSGLISRIQKDLGWEVEVNTGTVTLEKLQKYDILILTNPRRDITDEEANAIKEFVKQGGGLFILGDWYRYIYERSLNKVIEEFGIRFNDDELMDDEVNTGAPYFPLVGEFNFEHPATKFLDETSQLYYNGDTLEISGNAVWLIRGYGTSYAVDETEKVVKEKGSKPIVAAAVEVGEGRIIAYGSSRAISDSYYGKYIESNWAFVKGVLLWLAKET